MEKVLEMFTGAFLGSLIGSSTMVLLSSLFFYNLGIKHERAKSTESIK